MLDGLESKIAPVKEFEVLTNDEDRLLFMQAMAEQTRLQGLGFYIAQNNEFQGTISPGTYPINSGIFHGLPNLAALLSVTGFIFGTEHFMHGLTLPYLVAIVLIFITLNVNLGLSKTTSSIATLLFVISPIVLWTTKAALTEIYLAMIISMFCFYLTDKSNHASFSLWIPVAAFAFFHVSIFTIMPMFVLIFIGLGIYQRSFGAWLSGVISVILFSIGYLAMTYASPLYVFDNYFHLFELVNRLGFSFDRTNTQFILIFPVCFIAICLFGWVYYYYIHKNKVAPNIKKILPIMLQVAIIICICAIIYRWYTIARATPVLNDAYDRYHGAGLLRTIPNLRIFAYGFGCGFILLAVVVLAILRGDKRLITKDVFPLTIVFLYNVLFISAFLSTDVPYYYYFSRYIVPFLVVVVIIGGILIEKLHIAWKTVIAFVSLVVMIPFSIVLAFNKDISGMEIRSQREVISYVQSFEPGSVVIVEENLIRFLALNASFSSESNVFSEVLYNNLSDTSFIQGRDVYYIHITDEPIEPVNPNSIASIKSARVRLQTWVTGFSSGPQGLLEPIKDTYMINIDLIDINSEVTKATINIVCYSVIEYKE